jgi:hypothetical protein
VGHTTDADKLLEILGDELWALVADDPRRLAGKFFAGPLENRLDIQFSHLLTDFPVNDVSAITVQNAAHKVKSAAQVQVAYIDVPMFVRPAGLIETFAFARRFHVVPVEDASLLEYTVNARRTDCHDVRIEHLVCQPPVTIERMIPVKVKYLPLLPVFEPMVTWNPAVVFVHLAIALLPIVKGAFRHA